jgi:hypothetical protein
MQIPHREVHLGDKNVSRKETKPGAEWVMRHALLHGAARRIIPAVLAKGRRCMNKPRLLLLAPLAMLLAPFITPGQQQAPSTGGWQQSQRTDANGDKSSPQFSLLGKFLTRPKKDVGDPPALVVTCKPHASRRKFSTAYVNVGAPLNIEYVGPDEIKAGTSYFPKVTVRYRLDDQKEEKEQWTPGTEKTSASIPKAALEKMLRAHTVQIKVAEFHAGEISMQFDIPESTQVGTACGLPVRKK